MNCKNCGCELFKEKYWDEYNKLGFCSRYCEENYNFE